MQLIRRISAAPAGRATREGAVTVELAIVLPVFLMVVLGIVEFGRAMMVGQLVTNASRHGCRLAIVDGSSNADIEASVRALCVDSIEAPSTAFTVTIEVEQGPGNPNDPNDVLADAEPKDLCRVTVRVPYNEVDYLVGHWLAGVNLTGVCTMRHE